MNRPLEGRCVLVTGASRGIGAAISAGLARAGADVVGVARGRRGLETVRDDIVSAGGRAAICAADVTDIDTLTAAFHVAREEFGGVDLVVANAGIEPPRATIADADPRHWQEVLSTNVTGVALTIRAAVPFLRVRGGGRIITMGSGLGSHGLPGCGAYATSKAALTRLTEVAAAELIEDDVTVNQIIPGPVASAMSPDTASSPVAQAFPNEWRKRPEDVVPLVLYLATQPPPGPTGQTFSLMRR